MPEKSVREMNKLERLHYSLASRTFRATLIGSIILGLLALIIGLGWYTYSACRGLIEQSFSVAKNTAVILSKVVDPAPLAKDVMSVYGSEFYGKDTLPDPDSLSDDYYDKYKALTEREDYIQILSVLNDFKENNTLNDVYYAMYDEKTSMLVYIADPDDSEATGCRTGYYETVSQKELGKFLNWDGKSIVYHIEKTDRYGWISTSGVSIKSADGSVTGYILTDVTLREVASGMKRFVFQFSISMFVAVNLLAFFMTRHMKKKLVKPVNEIAQAAEAYIKDKREGVKTGDHFSDLNINTGDEIENLALIMSDMEGELAEYEVNLTKVAAEKERIGTELALATRIQADMLPNIFPAFPDRAEFDIYASMRPAKEVGGDFYDFFLIDNDHLGLVMADVSGKGVPAALLMMVSKILVQNIALSGKSPAEVLRTINSQMCANNREEMFITIWFGFLDLRDGRLVAANAGHEYPMLMKPGGEFETVKDKHGFVIGGFASSKYTEYELKLEPGAKLFLYTDGVTEATDDSGALFGTGRTVRALNKYKDGDPETIVNGVDNDIRDFAGVSPQFDDITMMCIQYFGEGVKGLKELTVEAKVENIAAVTVFINGELDKIECPFKARTQIDVAADELMSNISQYAYGPDGGTVTVRFGYDPDNENVEITFIDNGKPYDPLKKEDPDVTLGADEREVGGLGIFLVKKTMDNMEYEYKDGKNILKITKKI